MQTIKNVGFENEIKPEIKKKKKSNYFKHQQRMAYIFIVPPLILFATFVILPLIVGGVLAFTDYNVINEAKFIGFDNFRKILKDPYFYKALGNTLKYLVLTTPIAICLQLGAALLLNKNKRGIGFFRLCFYLPTLTSTVALTLIWSNILNPSGLLNQVLIKFNLIGPDWIASSDWAMVGVAIMVLWGSMGSNMMLYLAALQNAPHELYEAAEVDGAGAFRKFWNVTLPAISPTTFFITTTSIIGGLQAFEQVMLLTEGGPAWSTTTLTYYIYQTGMGKLEMGQAIAMSWLLFIVISIFTVINMKINKEKTDFV